MAAENAGFIGLAGQLQPSGKGPCLSAPKDEYDGLRQIHAGTKNGQSKILPTPVFVAVGLSLLYGQHGVQKENALLCPGTQVPRLWDGQT